MFTRLYRGESRSLLLFAWLSQSGYSNLLCASKGKRLAQWAVFGITKYSCLVKTLRADL